MNGDDGEVKEIRLMSGLELMLFIGWPRDRQNDLLGYSVEEMSLMAGGAFSGFAMLNVVSTAIYGWGAIRNLVMS